MPVSKLDKSLMISNVDIYTTTGSRMPFFSLTFEWGFSKALPILIRIDRDADSIPPGSPPP